MTQRVTLYPDPEITARTSYNFNFLHPSTTCVLSNDIQMLTATENTRRNGNHVSIPAGILRAQKSQGTGNRAFTAPAGNTSILFHNGMRPLRMIIDTPEAIVSPSFVDDKSLKASLRPDEVEIKALAYAINETDVEMMLENRGNTTSIGECAGVITALGSYLEHSFQIGDRVCGWNTNVAFASQTRVKGPFVQKIPDSWSAGMGAALSQNVSISYYGLSDCAQVESGQTVLVHGASSSLGQAVTLVANALGLQTIATVLTEAERQVLMSYNGIKPAHTLYSDDAALPQALLDLTGGAGVNVVFSTSSAALPEDLIKSVAPFGTVINIHGQKAISIPATRAIKYVSFDAGELLRHRPSVASTAFRNALTLLAAEHSDGSGLVPITTLHIADITSSLKAVRGQTHIGKMVLLAGEDTMVQVEQPVPSTTTFAIIEPLVHLVADLDIPQDQKDALFALIAQSCTAGSDGSSPTTISATTTPAMSATISSAFQGDANSERRLASATSMSEARQVISKAQLQKLASLVALGVDEVGPREPLVGLGLDSMMVIEFGDWIMSEFGADVSAQDILDSVGLEALATVVAQRSTFVRSGLTEEIIETLAPGTNKSAANGSGVSNGNKNGSPPTDRAEKREFLFVPNQLPRFPLPDIDALCNAFLTGVKAFATPSELDDTIRAVEDFKQPGSTGRALYDRAAVRAADPDVENWESELQLRRGFLDRRVSLTPCTSFWFGHPLSKRQHSQAERATLLAYTANNFRLRLEAGLVKPVVLNDQELTTAYYPWIFNAVRIPGVGSDEMQRHPNNDYCVVFWRGHAFQLGLCVGNRPATQQELFTAFNLILNQSVARSFVTIFTSDNRRPWAETRWELQQLDTQNATSIAAVEAAAFTISLDEATPMTAVERGRQFHFGGEKDAANRWHDKSLQFVVCRNGASGTLGEHSMLDALTMSELNDAIATAISSQSQPEVCSAAPTITPVPLPLKTDATLNAHIEKVRAQYAATVQGAEHAYFLFEGYGFKSLRAQKMGPKSVFQMIVQLAAQSLYGHTIPCFETVNQAHYHLGRVDIIQVVNPEVAAFLTAARDPSVDMVQCRALLGSATRAHVASINKARRNLGWERNLTALRALLREDEPVPALYGDPVYKRVRPRLLISNCFETGMMEKGCMSKDPEAVWLHYEVYEERYV